jgi:acyl-CoA-binding protein
MDIAELSMFLDSLGVGKGEQSQSEFEEAANAVKEMKNLDDVQKLQLYGLYKQSTIGDVTTDRPSMLDFAGAAKWLAVRDQ